MSRYRPPQKPSSRYITPEGYAALEKEHDYLWKDKRPKVTLAVSEAAALGDRSENAEYIYGKKQLREIDRRVRFLRKRLETLKVVDTLPSNPDKIYFGAWVELEDEDGNLAKYRIVGPDEFDLSKGYLSMDAPLARALMGKEVDDEVALQTPEGEKLYFVLAVEYTSADQ